MRENQLNLKVACLENGNQVLRSKLQREMKKNQELSDDLEAAHNENDELRQKLSLKIVRKSLHTWCTFHLSHSFQSSLAVLLCEKIATVF